MRNKIFIVPALILVLVIGLFIGFSQAARNKSDNNAQATKQPEKIYIPKDVKAIIQEGLATRQGRQDIPFTIDKNYSLPAGTNSQAVFMFKAKNADLDFAPVAPAAATDQQPPAEGLTSPKLQAKLNMFLQFQEIEDGVPTKTVREVYVPVVFEEEEAAFDPEKEQLYFTGYPLASGKYLLSMALTSLDLKKVGVAYCEFSLPDAAMPRDILETTPIFIVKSMEKMEAVETRTEVHKGFFSYSLLRITPNVDSVIAPGESIEILFYIYGTTPNEQNAAALEVSFEVKQNETVAIRWEPQQYDFAMISQPLPLKQTVMVKDAKGERKEIRDLPAGKYVLVINIKDKVSGKTVQKNLDFEVKPT